MTVRGNGNFETVTAPEIEKTDDFKVYEPTVIEQKRAEKVFEQIIIPKTSSAESIPKITFSFFNPKREIYQVINRGLIPIEVERSEGERELKIVEFPEGVPTTYRKEELGRDIIYIKETPGEFKIRGVYLYKSRAFALAHLFPLILLISLFAAHKRSERLKTDVRYARLTSAPRKAREGMNKAHKSLRANKPKAFCDAVFKTLQEYLGDKYGIATGGITMNVVEEVMRPKGVDEGILEKLKAVFTSCDMARYAPSEFTKKDMEETYRDLRHIIDHLERHK
jgi:hypothetical protein